MQRHGGVVAYHIAGTHHGNVGIKPFAQITAPLYAEQPGRGMAHLIHHKFVGEYAHVGHLKHQGKGKLYHRGAGGGGQGVDCPRADHGAEPRGRRRS